MKKFTNKINEEVSEELHIGDVAKVPLSLTTDPANRQGQTGEVVHITKNGDFVLEFEDGIIGTYGEGTLEINK